MFTKYYKTNHPYSCWVNWKGTVKRQGNNEKERRRREGGVEGGREGGSEGGREKKREKETAGG